MRREVFTCSKCGAVHWYRPAVCQRCGQDGLPPRLQRPPEVAAESQFHRRVSDGGQGEDGN